MNKTKKSFLLLLVSVMCMSLVFMPSYPVQAAESNSAQVWLTDVSGNKWLEQQNDVLFETNQTTNPLAINVDENRKYQEVQGFGAGMTDSSAWLIWNKMSESQRTALMNGLFDSASGIGLSLLRTPMGATDFNASGNYSYNDMPAGETDPTLAGFSIEHDEDYIIPALKEALSLNPSMKIMATPWSPPGWMKTSDSMIGGTLKEGYYDELANYFVKYVQAYDNAGVPVSYVTPQNEPMGTPTYPGMFLSAYQESALIKEMGEAFAANHISTKILAWDHNWDVPSYPEKIFSDPDASQYAVGTGWHIYSGNPITQTLVHNDYPGKEVFITEGTGGIWQANDQEAFYDSLNTWIINGMRNWADGVILWNIALDPERGPLNSDTDGEAWVRGLLTINPDNGEVTKNVDYYALAHASKFVKTGAYRIYSNTFGEGSIENVAFQNPDGSKVLIAYNSGSDSKTFSVADGTQTFDYTLNAGNAVTFKWEGPQQSGTTPAAASVTDATYDFRFSDSAIITYDPELLDFQNTIPTGNSFVTYSLPVGAAIQTAGTVLDRSGWTVTASSNSVGDGTGNAAGDAALNAIDGDLDTRWTTGHGLKNGDWYQIDLGSPANIDQIVLENGANSSFDYMTKYQVYVSNDGVNWGSAIAQGSGGIGEIAITVPTQTAQYIRIVSTGTSGFWWSVSEINVYGSSSETGSIAAPTEVSNGLELENWTGTEEEQVTVVYNGTGSSQSFPLGSFTYTLQGGTSAMFTTKDSTNFPTPAFGSLTPNEGIVGHKVTIDGSNFGDVQRLGMVNFGSIPANISSWSDSRIIAYVPDGLQSGSVAVSVYGSDGSYAGGSSFNVKSLPAPLPKMGWTATATDISPWGDGNPENMLDGTTNTRYSSGVGQYNGLSVTVDMGQAQTFNKILLNSGNSTDDYSRGADLYVSMDNTEWTKVSSIAADGQAVQLAAFEAQTARYIKVVNTASAGNWWSIAEFDVYNSRASWAATASDVSPWGDGAPGNMLDGSIATQYKSGTGQYDGLYFTVDMGQTEAFNKIVIDSGSGSNDYARSADVYVSSDGTDWTKVSSIKGSGPVQEATFEMQTARYIKVVNTGTEGYWWSVAEFDAYIAVTDYRAGWTATATDVSPWGDGAPGNMLDGNSSTQYKSGTGQYEGLSFTVDMGQTETFNKIVIDSGSGSNDYARSADVFVSTDRTNWTKVTSVTGSGPVQEVAFQAQTARYIKVVVTGNEGYWWSVAEFNVYNEEDTDYRAGWTATATDVSPWGDVPGNMLDGNASTRYSSGTGQYDGLSFTVDMGQTETFNKLVIDSGSGSNDYARSSDVFVSTDGTDWTKVTSVTGSGPVQEVTFQTQTARYIKVVVTGNEGYWWSVAEFDVYNTDEEPLNIYKEVYFKHEGEEITSLTARDTVRTITLEAWGKTVADGEADVNITSDAAWSVQSGEDVVSVINGIVTIKKDGNAVVKITYGEIQATLSLVINKTTTPAPDPEEEPETIQNPDGSTTTIDGSKAVTEYTADLIFSKITAIDQQNVKQITITLPESSASIHELVLAADAVEKIVNEKLDLKVELENNSLSIPSSVLKEMTGDLIIEIKTLTDNEKQNVLTSLNGLKATGPVIEFTLTSVEGNVQNSVTKFKEKATIEIDAEGITSNTDTKKLGIYYLDETSGTWIYVGGKYNSATGKVEAKTGHFTKFAVMEYNKSFSDIGSTHWAKANIEVMAAKHIASGISETRFDPAGKVTRAQFATFLVRALGIDLPAYKGTFTDVPEGQWYTEYVEAAQASGIINGVGNDRFDPDKEMTREQMAVMVINAYTYATGQTTYTVGNEVNAGFDDLDQAASWSKDAIQASFKLGIINGVSRTSYEPGMLAQRDQAASIIYRFLEAIGEL
ncbi:discoidin domain-containing protein [Paenibacillus harenae]|uniref:O-glycosyl hydrolase n=1 Tax=Paenibacillus harenae TaxID=306543 RepID=A0ABT9U2D7_PAEHA|nr:discoidin domain-containing protein [Paenibacillus harenae]MDQ0113794.1 O-glycosyl hydrolase [Paenibacillus harenae]